MSTKTVVCMMICVTSIFCFVHGMPPHPDLLEKVNSGKIEKPYFMENIQELYAQGINQRDSNTTLKNVNTLGDYINVLVILVDFSDHPAQVESTEFDSLYFDSVGITVHDFYKTVSKSKINITTVHLPSSNGWLTAPNTYAYYTNNNNGVGIYPQNCQRLVEDLVNILDPIIDFSLYDNDSNGFVDYLAIVHSGQGAEVSGSDDDIWSHKWGISPKLTNDGVLVSSYSIHPEFISHPNDMTIGVFCHELGHKFGLPDLYDTDYSSNGVGRWGVMGYGSWLGPEGKGGMPAQFSAWIRLQLGIDTVYEISTSRYQHEFFPAGETKEIIKLWTNGTAANEYFLVENRQKIGYDSYLPSEGLLIWHVDESKHSNADEWYPGLNNSRHYLVALEQADGNYDLEHSYNTGDSGDPFPGSSNAVLFDNFTIPSSQSYTNDLSNVAVENINLTGRIARADLKVADCCSGISGNINGDANEVIDIADVMVLINFMFYNRLSEPVCYEEADIDGSGVLDASDLVRLVSYLFQDGPAPMLCN